MPDLANITTLHDINYLLTATQDLHDHLTPDTHDKPQTWAEAKQSGDAQQWETAYCDELDSLRDMGVYKLVPRTVVPASQKVRTGSPVFKIKRDEHGKAIRFKVRLVFWGYEQIYGRDYTKTTSPTAHMESWQILLHLAATKG